MQMTGSNHKNMIPPQCQSLNLSILMFSSCLVWQGTFHANKNFNKPNSFPYSKPRQNERHLSFVFRDRKIAIVSRFSMSPHWSQCLKITEKVSFNIANWPKMVNLRSNSVTRHDAFHRTKIGENGQNWKWDRLGWFSNTVNWSVICPKCSFQNRWRFCYISIQSNKFYCMPITLNFAASKPYLQMICFLLSQEKNAIFSNKRSEKKNHCGPQTFL